jgi:O-acetyl-ADP-ribose deacetylase (regulator of RNase III)
MIQTKVDNILTADVEAIVNTVNCVGVMGKGIALQFKMKYPENYQFYKKICDQGRMMVGKVLIYERQSTSNPKYIINFPTKRHWKGKSTIEDIRKGLDSLISEIKNLKIKSIAIPALGSGLGGLDWQQVKLIIIDAFSILPNVDVWLYEPHYSPSVQSIEVNTKKPKMTLTKALLIKLMQAYQALGYSHSLLEIQKLTYFINVLLHQELKFNFKKSNYGPYASTINHLLQNMENHYTRGFGDRIQKAEVRLLDNAIQEADVFLSGQENYIANINQVKRLVDGFETPFGMELLSTVHWVATQECNINATNEEIISKVHQWNNRKEKLFQPHHINIAINRLKEEFWIK